MKITLRKYGPGGTTGWTCPWSSISPAKQSKIREAVVCSSRLFPGAGGSNLRQVMSRVVTHLMQEFAQALASFVQLRFGIAHRAAEHAGDFVVLVTVNIVKEEHGLVASR